MLKQEHKDVSNKREMDKRYINLIMYFVITKKHMVFQKIC
jgi:hypothetical protein